MSKTILSITIILIVCSVGISQIKPRKVKQQSETVLPTATNVETVVSDPIVEDQARELFFVSDKKGQGRNIGMQVKVYQMLGNCDFSVVSPYKQFASGDRIRFSIETNIDGYVYVIGQGTSGKARLLYPLPQINKGNNFIRRGAELIVPGTDWFRFDNRAGVEEVKVVVSKNKLDLLRHLMPRVGGEQVVAKDVEADILTLIQDQNESKDFIFTKEGFEDTTSTEAKDIIYQPLYAVNRERGSYTVLTLKLRHR